MKHVRALAATAAVTTLLTAGCMTAESSRPPASSSSPSEVTVSTPPDSPSPTSTPSAPASNANFDAAIKFVELVLSPDSGALAKTRDLIKPESAAARYVAHQTLLARAESLANLEPSTQEPTLKGDARTGQIKISYEAVEGEGSAQSYTWKDFTFDQGKVAGWTGPNGPVGSVLWSRQTSDESRGRSAVLKSAYQSNSGNLFAVVELSSKIGTDFSTASYAAKGGYRQDSADQNASKLAKGEKTLAYFEFDDAKFGGQLYIPYYDEDGTSDGDWVLKLAIK